MSELDDAIARLEQALARLEAASAQPRPSVDGEPAGDERAAEVAAGVAARLDAALAKLDQLLAGEA